MKPDMWIGVDVGGTKVLAAIVTGSGLIVESLQRDTPASLGSGEELLDTVAGLAGLLVSHRPVAGIGLAAAGLVDASGEHVVFAPHLPWRDAAVRTQLERRLDLPVVMDNDANCAALAEATHGAAADASSALVVTVGTGIGGAFVIGDRVWRGAHGMAGEFGHVRVVPDGEPCECGRRGCWEQYCSGNAIAQLAGVEPSRASGEELSRALAGGDESVRRAYVTAGEWLGRGLADLVAVLDPEVVVVGGGVSDAGEVFLEPARAQLSASLFGAGHRAVPRLVRAALGPQAGAVGAALLARGGSRAEGIS